MKTYVKIYLQAFGIGEQDVILCETPQGLNSTCTHTGVDFHHLTPKGMGGSKHKDNINNLIALCRFCHEKAHSDKKFNQKLKDQVKKRTELLRRIPL